MADFKIVLKIFFRNNIYSAGLFLLLIGLHIYNIPIFMRLSSTDSLWYLNKSLILSTVTFVFCMFYSLDMLLQYKESKIIESMGVIPNSNINYIKNVLLINTFISFILFINQMIYIIIFVGNHDNEIIFHLFKVSLYYFFIVPFASGFIGVMMGYVFNRIICYLLMFIFLFFATPLSEYIASTLMLTSEINIYPFTDFFKLIPQELNIYLDYLYGIFMENYKWYICIFWIALSMFFIIFNSFKNIQGKKIFKTFSMFFFVTLTILSFYNVIYKDSVQIRDSRPDGMSWEQIAYKNKKRLEEKADFKISKYNINLSISNKLYADIEIHLENHSKQNNQYKFTLYSGYAISEIKDQNGNKIEYVRHDDYLDIFAPDDIESIKIKYSGYSPKFYSNYQGILLCGYFPYYPIEGYKKIFLREGNMKFNTLVENHIKEFNVNIKSKVNVFSNLNTEKITNNIYRISGEATSLTILGGFLQEHSIDGITVYDIYAEHYFNEEQIIDINKYRKLYCDLLNIAETNITINKYFNMPITMTYAGHDESFVYIDDYILATYYRDGRDVIKKIILEKNTDIIGDNDILLNFLILNIDNEFIQVENDDSVYFNKSSKNSLNDETFNIFWDFSSSDEEKRIMEKEKEDYLLIKEHFYSLLKIYKKEDVYPILYNYITEKKINNSIDIINKTKEDMIYANR